MALGQENRRRSTEGYPEQGNSGRPCCAFKPHRGQADEVIGLWDQVAEKDPAKALELYTKLAQFSLPMLSRSTVDGDLGIRGKLVIDG
jgi:hypothetical protein